MASTDSAVAILPIDLGTAAAFDQNVFPLAYCEDGGDNLSKGNLLIRATLQEMEKIKQLGIDLNQTDDFIFRTRIKVEDLKVEKAKLQDNRKTLNPFKAFLNYRAARLFHAGSRALYLQTKRTSEKIHREEERMRVVPSTQMRRMNDVVSPEAVIVGVAVDLPDGLNNNAQQTINDVTATLATAGPFQDNPLVSQLRDDEHVITLTDTASLLSQDGGSGVDEGNRTSVASSDLQLSRPTSPQNVTYIQFFNSMVAAGSNLNAPTVSSGSRNSGASVTQEFAP